MSSDGGKQPRMELLAPAGDRESLLAAVAAGADAVYLGGKMLNARRSAANFDLDQLQAAGELLHLRDKKLYVAVNTLAFDTELGPALEYLTQLYNMGVDAVIIQDLGLIKLARKYLPDLELHASTQMTVHNSEGARLLGQMGLRRVVLARELTRPEVAEIVAHTDLEVEVFVHGALCVCYSGQCLLSSMIGGRSGNRGRCAQPCRMEYQLMRNGQPLVTKGTYLLSPKDLALLPVIPELDRAGVASLKIEGRMKRPEYVFAVVGTYRRALDRYYADPCRFQAEPRELRELEESFNRGFSTGYFGGNRNAALMSFSRPNNRGVFLGRVTSADHERQLVTLKLEADLEAGDGVEVWVSRGGRGAITVQELECQGKTLQSAPAGQTVTFAIDGKAYPGDRVFKVYSRQLVQQTQEAVDPDRIEAKIPCNVAVRGNAGEPMEVRYRDEAGYEGTALTKVNLEAARNKPLTPEVLREYLGRLGTTPFYMQDLTFTLPPGLMMPFSELNQVRRAAVDQLLQNRLARYQRRPVRLNTVRELAVPEGRRGQATKPRPLLSVWAGDLDSVKAAANAGAAIIYAGGEELTEFRWTESHLKQAIEAAHAGGAKLIAAMPRINAESQKDLWQGYLGVIAELNGDGILVSDLGVLHLVLQETQIPIYLNHSLNFLNSCALQAFEDPRIEQIAVSPELTLKQIRELNPAGRQVRLEAVVQGPLELMVSEYCPVNSINSPGERCTRVCKSSRFALRDRMNLDFMVYTDQFCRMHLFNSKDHCLYGELEKVASSGLDVLRLELKTSPAPEVEWLTRRYHNALETIVAGAVPVDGEAVIAEFKARTGREITKGHYFRGVD